jgi:hypothetical protein
MARCLAEAGPWGQAFPEPLFHGEFELVSQRVVGEDHLKLVVRSATAWWTPSRSGRADRERGAAALVYRLHRERLRRPLHPAAGGGASAAVDLNCRVFSSTHG